MSKNGNLHPDYGQYDRFLFNTNGELAVRAHLLDDRGVLIKLGNRMLSFDRPVSRLNISGKKNPQDRADFPVTQFMYGEGDAFGYSVIVDDQDIKTNPAKYILISRIYGRNSVYLGGLSAYSVDSQGMWKGMTQGQFNGWINWLDSMFQYDPETYKGLKQWANKCKVSASMRFAKTSVNILAEARRGQLAVVENTPPVEQPKEIEKEKLPVVIEQKEPEKEVKAKPVPLYGRVSEIDKVPENIIAVG